RPHAHADRAADSGGTAHRARTDARRRGVPHRDRVRVAAMTEVVGIARLGRRTKDLVKRLRPGDLAIIDHADLDRVSAEELADGGVKAVVNVSPSSSGRFPNPGPLELVRAGVCLVDASPGADLFETVSEGEMLTLRSGSLWRNGTRLAEGVELTERDLAAALA